MSIFSKLNPLAKKKTLGYPPGSEQRVRALLADLDSSNPTRLLKDVEERLTEISGLQRQFGAETAQLAFAQLDQSGYSVTGDLLQKYLSSLDRQSSSQAEWSALDDHAAELINAHAVFYSELIPLAQSETERNHVARDAIAMLRAWSLRKKLQHFRYRKPAADLWQQAHALLTLLQQHGQEQHLVVPYPGESATSALREYLVGVYFECLPKGKLLPQQQEALERFLRSGERLVFTSALEPNATHRIDLRAADGPLARKDGDTGGASVYFLSTLPLHEKLIGLADALASAHDVPKWLSALALNPAQKEAAFRSVGHYWSSHPPRRIAPRRNESQELRVVIGFEDAYQMVNASQDVRAYCQQKDTAGAEKPSEKSQLNLLRQIETGGRIPTSLSLETDGRKVGMETWQHADASTTGFSATLPALLPRHGVGSLIAVRPVDGVAWRLGIIRRVGRDATNRPLVGVETIDDEAVCGHANLIDSDHVWSEGVQATGWSNVIFPRSNGNDLLLLHGSFSSGKMVRAISGTRAWYICLDSLLERGADFDRVKFTSTD